MQKQREKIPSMDQTSQFFMDHTLYTLELAGLLLLIKFLVGIMAFKKANMEK